MISVLRITSILVVALSAMQLAVDGDWDEDIFEMELPSKPKVSPRLSEETLLNRLLNSSKFEEASSFLHGIIDVQLDLSLKATVYAFIETRMESVPKFTHFADGSMGVGSLVHRAASSGDLEMLKLSLTIGFDVNARDESGKTPVMYAIGKPDIFEFLLSRADLTLFDYQRMTVLNLAIMGGHVGTVERLLEKEHVALNQPDLYRHYPIFNAVVNRFPRAIVEKMSNRADVDLNVRTMGNLSLKDIVRDKNYLEYSDLF